MIWSSQELQMMSSAALNCHVAMIEVHKYQGFYKGSRFSFFYFVIIVIVIALYRFVCC